MLGVVINMYIYVNYLLSIISTFDDIVNPLYNDALGDQFFFLTLMNYDQISIITFHTNTYKIVIISKKGVHPK
jgi:hypothetical protein